MSSLERGLHFELQILHNIPNLLGKCFFENIRCAHDLNGDAHMLEILRNALCCAVLFIKHSNVSIGQALLFVQKLNFLCYSRGFLKAVFIGKH